VAQASRCGGWRPSPETRRDGWQDGRTVGQDGAGDETQLGQAETGFVRKDELTVEAELTA
jgi:hypothetical protein